MNDSKLKNYIEIFDIIFAKLSLTISQNTLSNPLFLKVLVIAM